MRKDRFLIGVIGTEIHSIEQREMLDGILRQAQQDRADVAVLSNVFNPLEPEKADCCENQIYDLVLSPDLDAVIMLSESFVNERLRSRIRELLLKRTDIPVILLGAALGGFDFPHFSTSDANDIEEITDHLIEGHGFRDITLLTGPLSLDVSRVRIEGYRRSLKRHGIPFDESKVYEGDFWYHSGSELAKAFLSGEKPMPEALVCANDYMAFGVLDAFEYAGVNILDNMAVIGYEFIPERNLHTPLLTTYQRNRRALGSTAVRIIRRQLRGEPPEPFAPPRGRLIHGVTCSCNVSRIRQHEELVTARQQKQYADWNLKSELDRLLTACTNMDAFADAMGQFQFMLRGVNDIFLCLFEDWHRQERSSEILLCRSVNLWTDHTVFRLKKTDLAGIVSRREGAAHYWLPLCFADRLFGYCVLHYDHPDSFDDVCRSWMKSVANGLEFLRLKADVRYLLQCRTLSGSYDSMTEMFSADGLKSAYQLMQNAAGIVRVTALLLRCCTGQDPLYSAEDAGAAVEKLLAAANILHQYQGKGICGRISEQDFLLLLPTDADTAELLAEAVAADMVCVLEIGSFLCTAQSFPREASLDELVGKLTADAAAEQSARDASRLRTHYAALYGIRKALYSHPAGMQTLEEHAAALGFHTDYLNRRYKEYFGVSFHQDCIRSRVLHAAHLLMHTALTVSETAEQCGYTDSKYFIRQFAAVTGCPPRAFRERIRMHLEIEK